MKGHGHARSGSADDARSVRSFTSVSSRSSSGSGKSRLSEHAAAMLSGQTSFQRRTPSPSARSHHSSGSHHSSISGRSSGSGRSSMFGGSGKPGRGGGAHSIASLPCSPLLSVSTGTSGAELAAMASADVSPDQQRQFQRYSLPPLISHRKAMGQDIVPEQIPADAVIVARRADEFGGMRYPMSMPHNERSFAAVFRYFVGTFWKDPREQSGAEAPGGGGVPPTMAAMMSDDDLDEAGGPAEYQFGAVPQEGSTMLFFMLSIRNRLMEGEGGKFIDDDTDQSGLDATAGLIDPYHGIAFDDLESIARSSDSIWERFVLEGDGEAMGAGVGAVERALPWFVWKSPAMIFRIVQAANAVVKRFLEAGQPIELRRLTRTTIAVMRNRLANLRKGATPLPLTDADKDSLAKEAAALVKSGVAPERLEHYRRSAPQMFHNMLRTHKKGDPLPEALRRELVRELRRRHLFGFVGSRWEEREDAAPAHVLATFVMWAQQRLPMPEVSVFTSMPCKPTRQQEDVECRERRIFLVYNMAVPLRALFAMRAELVVRLEDALGPPGGASWHKIVTSHYYSRTLGVPLPGSAEGPTICHWCNGLDATQCICSLVTPVSANRAQRKDVRRTALAHPALELAYILRGWGTEDSPEGRLWPGTEYDPDAGGEGEHAEKPPLDEDDLALLASPRSYRSGHGSGSEDEADYIDVDRTEADRMDVERVSRRLGLPSQRRQGEESAGEHGGVWEPPSRMPIDAVRRGCIVPDRDVPVATLGIPVDYAPFTIPRLGKFSEALPSDTIQQRMPITSKKEADTVGMLLNQATMLGQSGRVVAVYKPSDPFFHELCAAARSAHPRLAKVSLLGAVRRTVSLPTTMDKIQREGEDFEKPKRKKKNVFELVLYGMGAGYCPVRDPAEKWMREQDVVLADASRTFCYRMPSASTAPDEVASFGRSNRLCISRDGMVWLICTHRCCNRPHLLGQLDSSHRMALEELHNSGRVVTGFGALSGQSMGGLGTHSYYTRTCKQLWKYAQLVAPGYFASDRTLQSENTRSRVKASILAESRLADEDMEEEEDGDSADHEEGADEDDDLDVEGANLLGKRAAPE